MLASLVSRGDLQKSLCPPADNSNPIVSLQDKYGLSPVAAAVAASHRDTAKALEDEACRSSDFQKRDSVDAAYRTMEKPQKPGLKDDIDDVPEVLKPVSLVALVRPFCAALLVACAAVVLCHLLFVINRG